MDKENDRKIERRESELYLQVVGFAKMIAIAAAWGIMMGLIF